VPKVRRGSADPCWLLNTEVAAADHLALKNTGNHAISVANTSVPLSLVGMLHVKTLSADKLILRIGRGLEALSWEPKLNLRAGFLPN